MKKHSLLFLLIVICSAIPQYQTLLAQSLGKITGEVRDNDNKTVLSATVSLLKIKDSALAKITLTTDDGKFQFENVKFGIYRISVTHLDAKKYISGPLSISAENSPFSVPTIALKSSDPTELKSVSVTAKKPFLERKIDRTIINVDALISNAGVSAWEVLEKSPGIMTQETGEIAMSGKQGVMIFIDDKPTYLQGADLMNYLKSLPSGSLDKIELMTTPPAKYDAAGNAGIINIKTKKTQLEGSNGGITLSYGQGRYPKSNNSFTFNYRNNKFNIFTTIGNAFALGFNDLTLERRFRQVDGSFNGSFNLRSDISRYSNAANAKLGIDYYLNKKTTLSFVSTGLVRATSSPFFNEGYSYNAVKKQDSIITADVTDKVRLNSGSLTANLRHELDKSGKVLTIDADFVTFQSTRNQLFKNATYTADNQLFAKDEQIGALPSNIDIYALKTDYEQPLKNGIKLSMGLKSSFIKTNNDAEYFTKIDNTSKPNYDLTNYFIYKENINAAYVSANKDWKRLSLQAGLRLENTVLDGNQLGNAQKKGATFNRDSTFLFPTLYLSYKLDTNNRHQIGFNYSSRIDRPNFEFLNPFQRPLDRYTNYEGNPYLKSQISHNFELSHTYKTWLNTTLAYSKTTDLIAETIEFKDKIYFSRPNNLGQRNITTLTVTATLKPSKKWTATLTSTTLHLAVKTKLYNQDIDTSNVFTNLNLVNQFQLGKGWSAELSGFYQTQTLFSQLAIVPQAQVNIGCQKKVLKNKGTLKFNVSDIFYTRVNGGTIYFLQNAESTYRNYQDTRVGTLTFTYNFNKGITVKGARKTGGAEDEKSRARN